MPSRATFIDDTAERTWPNPWGAATGRRYRALCADGIVRTATAVGEPDSAFTIPARVKVNGRTVTGSVYHRGSLDYSRPGWPDYSDRRTIGSRTPQYRFSPDAWRKNADALPAWPTSVRASVTAADGR